MTSLPLLLSEVSLEAGLCVFNERAALIGRMLFVHIDVLFKFIHVNVSDELGKALVLRFGVDRVEVCAVLHQLLLFLQSRSLEVLINRVLLLVRLIETIDIVIGIEL